MKNWIKTMFIVLFGMMVTSFTACGGDDESGSGGTSSGGSSYTKYNPNTVY